VSAEPPAEAPAPRERLLSLDAFRGLTVAGMLLVNDPGSWSDIYPPLEHAPWHGWTPTDLVFPFFLFIVGITTHISLGGLRARGASDRDLVRRIVKRGLLIVLFGLILNAFPFYWWGKTPGLTDPTVWQRMVWRAQHLRFCGVLQRIGVAYLAGALIAMRTTRRQKIGVIAAILVGYWLVMTLIPVPGSGVLGALTLDQPDQTLAAWSDRLILGPNHIWSISKTWDPEGPLSTVPAVATVLLGVLAGEWLTEKKRALVERIAGLFAAGALAMLAGSLWGWVFPINKNLWTSSYVVFSAGFACVVLATCLWLIDLRGIRGWARPFVVYGMNPLVAFLGSGIMARCIDSLIKVTVRGERMSLHQASFQLISVDWLSPRFVSLIWGLAFVAFWLGVLSLLHRRNIYLKV
jgi:predicted acyltransferase